MTAPDPRLTLARADLAADWLEGVVPAARYAPTEAMTCRAPQAAVRRAPHGDAEQWDQLLFGERFDVLDQADGWAWGQARRDGYVGWVETGRLAPARRAPTHWVNARAAHAFAGPDIKSPPHGPFAMNSLVIAEVREGRFLHAVGAGWFVEAQLSPIGEGFADPAAVAERFVGAPYLWGGRGPWGVDCSGLIQQALFACAQACPRDADQQAALGRAVAESRLQRGDLVFWPGHVAMMLDKTRLIHANGDHMAVVIEPLADAIARILAGDGREPSAFRRP